MYKKPTATCPLSHALPPPSPHGHVAMPRGGGWFRGFAPPTPTPIRPPSSYVHVALELCCLPVFHQLCYPFKAILTVLLPPSTASNAKPLIRGFSVGDSWNSHCQCRWLPGESPPRQGALSLSPPRARGRRRRQPSGYWINNWRLWSAYWDLWKPESDSKGGINIWGPFDSYD